MILIRKERKLPRGGLSDRVKRKKLKRGRAGSNRIFQQVINSDSAKFN